MFRKKDTFTVITPIPGFIPRQLAIDILHAHSEVITLNPLVIDHRPIPAPSDAETDEYYSTWYEITERVQFVPGIGKMGSSTIKFNGCFHDMPWGLQTHVYAPMHVDLRHKYTIAGNQPGVEPPEIPEIGLRALGAPAEGLYLREDIEVRCNVTVMSFVKSQLKKAGGEMVKRIIKKAELLDAGVLQAMIENGRLKTINPADRSKSVRSPVPSPISLHYTNSASGSPPLGSPPTLYQVPRIQSGYAYYRPGTSASQESSHIPRTTPDMLGTPLGSPGFPPPQELPATEVSSPVAAAYTSPQPPVEMPGDFYHAPPALQPGRKSPPRQCASIQEESPLDPQLQQQQQQYHQQQYHQQQYHQQQYHHQQQQQQRQQEEEQQPRSPPPQYVAYNPNSYAKFPVAQQQYLVNQQQQGRYSA